MRVASPTLDPTSVMLAEPVAARFSPPLALIKDPSLETRELTLPTSCPTLIATFRLPWALPTPWQRIDESDSHVVRSPAVKPKRASPLVDALPKLLPCTVILADPVVALFVCRPELTDGNSAVVASVIVPCRCPTLIANRWLPRPKAADLQRTAVSASQAVRSHAVDPQRIAMLDPSAPTFAPLIVMLADPDLGLFPCPATLNPPISNENGTVMLPTAAPTVKDTRLLEAIPNATRHRTSVSAIHVVDSHAEIPNRTATVIPIGPMLAPCTVTLADPDAALFASLCVLIDDLSEEKATDTLPTTDPTVDKALRLPATECPNLQCTALPEIHSVRSHDVSPSPAAPEYAARLMLAPLRDTLIDPVAAPFARIISDTDPASTENKTVELPCIWPALITKVRLPVIAPNV